MERTKWIVDSKYTTRKEMEDSLQENGESPDDFGIEDYQELEISVIREDNKNGIRSYGWADKDKLVLFDGLDVDEKELKWMEEVATTIAEVLNTKGL